MTPMNWLILIVALLIIEACTGRLTTIWFVGGAIVSFLASCAGAGIVIELVLFAAVSLVLLICTRPLAMRYINGKETKRTNVDSCIGQTVKVTERVDNLEQTGGAVLAGMPWSARSADDGVTFEPGENAIVSEVRGVKLILKKTD